MAGVERGADIFYRGKERVVFDVDEARGLVAAFDVFADAVEGPALVTEERAIGDAGVGLALFLEVRAEAGDA